MIVSGTRLGPYVIAGPIGSGGMGEVYKAHDPRLGRDVAVKVLPAGLSADTERLTRFEQEARAAAALNHPNILAVYDIGQDDGAPYIVSELLEGETLRGRLHRGALPLRKAVEYAIHIAHGLAAAHERGIVHRDLKPENIFVTADGRVKILDFGLAKLTQPERALAGLSELPTTPNTSPGVVLGTIGYMAPEQVRGQPADHRADIFAFGAILYESLSGRRAFRGETAIETMSAILKEDPPELPMAERHIPPALARMVDHCLEKNPAARFKSADDLAFAMEAVSSESGRAEVRTATDGISGRRSHARWQWITVGAITGAVAGALFTGVPRYLSPAPTNAGVAYRAALLPPATASLPASVVPSGRFALSPDGRRLAFVGTESGGGLTRLWVQTLDGRDAQPLVGTEGVQVPFWSPDSRLIGFRAGGKVKTIDAGGGPTLHLADTIGSPGGTWNSDGVILFGTFGPGNPIRRVSASGGPVSEVTTLDTANGELYHGYPFFLPDGRHFLYFSVGTKVGAGPNGVYITALNSTERKLLVPGGSNASYAQGYLFFLREQTLMAQPFDVERLELTGEAVAIAEQIATGGLAGTPGAFTVSQTGILAYQTGPANVGGQAVPLTQLTWFDRSGKQMEPIGDPAQSVDIELAPDGSRAVMRIFDLVRRASDIWLADIRRGLRTRFTFDSADENNPIWSPDGNRVVFSSRRKGHFDLYVKASSGAGAEEELLADGFDKWPVDWSPDARFILYVVAVPQTGNDLWVLPLFGDRKPLPFLQTASNELVGQFSSDSRWVAYQSNESGRDEVYVASFPDAGGKWQISSGGGTFPRWRRDGREIFYRALDNRLMAAEVDGRRAAFQVGTVRPLFNTRPGGPNFVYDVTPDGQRFLINTLVEEAASAPITLVVNWPASLTK